MSFAVFPRDIHSSRLNLADAEKAAISLVEQAKRLRMIVTESLVIDADTDNTVKVLASQSGRVPEQSKPGKRHYALVMFGR